tara:strand:+ start:419 stop:1264 length:846 start_codon:yes stop_codon:yes gene_type:complete
MTKKSHNKKRNVGILYELLLNTAARGLVESNRSLTQKSQKLIKRFFNSETELYKEHRLFKALVEPYIEDGALATKILGEAKRAARTHNKDRLTREKSKLIREINHSFGKDFYNQRVDNYVDYATVQTLLNDWRAYEDAPIDRVVLYESKVHSILIRQKEDLNLSEEQDKEVDNLVIKVMAEKFNNKYSNQLSDLQQLLIKEYVFNENTEGKAFKSVLNRIKETVLRDLTEYSMLCDNEIVASKIAEVKGDIRSLNTNTLNDQTMERFLTLCSLSEELRRKE